MYQKNIVIDVDRAYSNRIPSVQGDSGRKLKIKLVNQGRPMNLENARVVLSAKKPDGKEVFNDTEIVNASTGEVLVTLTSQLNATVGQVECTLKTYNGTDTVTTRQFYVSVGESAGSSTASSSNELRALNNALNSVQNIDNRFNTVNNRLSLKADNSTVVKKGYGTLNDFDEETRRVILGMEQGNVNAVLGTGNVTKDNLQNRAVSVEKTDFLTPMGNIYFDESTMESGKRIGVTTDRTYVLEDNSLYYTTGFIPVSTAPLTVYHIGRVAFFNSNQTVLDFWGQYSASEEEAFNKTITPVANTAYVKISFLKSSLDEMYIEQNGNRIEASSGVLFDKLVLNAEQMAKSFENLPRNSVPVESLSSIKIKSSKSLNLFNKENLTQGCYETVNEIVENGDGTSTTVKRIVFNPNHGQRWTSELIPCQHGKTYAKTGIPHDGVSTQQVAMFNEDGEPVRLLMTQTLITPAPGEVYFAVYVDKGSSNYREYPLGWHPDNMVVVEGNALPEEYIPYRPYKYLFEGLELEDSVKNDLYLNAKDYYADDRLPVTCVQSFDVVNPNKIVYEDNKAFVAPDQEGYINSHTPIDKEGCSITQDFIAIPDTVTAESVWEFKNVGRMLFYDEGGAYRDALYRMDFVNKTSAAPASVALFTAFPSLANKKFFKVCIFTEHKRDWSIKVDGVELVINTTVRSSMLEIDKNNFSKDLQLEFDAVKDKSFNNNADTNYVFKKGVDFSSKYFRIPFMCVTNQGTIVAGCDIRYNSGADHSFIDLGTARSVDGGKTWIDKTVAIENNRVSSTYSRVMDGTILATSQGRIFLIGNKFNDGNTGWTQVNTPNDPNWDIVLYHSDDDGRTWEFNQSLKSLLPLGQISFLGGVGSGIEMSDGTLVFPIQMARYQDIPHNCQSGIIYSRDNGETWQMSSSLIPEYSSECSVVEYPTGTLIINCRQEGQNHRSVFSTTDFGTTWTATPMNEGTYQPSACQGHMIKIKDGANREVIIFSNPRNSNRADLTLSVLVNDNRFLPVMSVYRPVTDGYSCMAFDEKRNRLYLVMEVSGNLVFKDLTNVLPTLTMYKHIERTLI